MTCRLCEHVFTDGFVDPHGACRRFPPHALDANSSAFPIVELDQFSCGEFARGKRTANPTPSKPGIKERKLT